MLKLITFFFSWRVGFYSGFWEEKRMEGRIGGGRRGGGMEGWEGGDGMGWDWMGWDGSDAID